MKLLALFAAVLLVVNASTDKDQWAAFKQTHGKTYGTPLEERTRFSIFQSNLRKIEEHNARYDRGEVTYHLGVTPFADITQEEFKAMLRRNAENKPELEATPVKFSENLEVPDSIDWTEKGAVLFVKDQGACGSCWAFSATGALEGQNAIINNVSTPLSEQQLLDCSGSYGNGDCKRGGKVINAFKYVVDNGIESESTYTYERKQGSCRYSANDTVLKIKEYKKVAPNVEDLQKAVGTIGPISASVYIDNLMMFYDGGIYDGSLCPPETDHDVLVVGYGESNETSPPTKFWKVKNSWGRHWGEKGYFRLLRTNESLCGIASECSYPVLN